MVIINFQAYIPFIAFTLLSIIANSFLLKESKQITRIFVKQGSLKRLAIINIIFLSLNLLFPPITDYTGSLIAKLYTFLLPILLISIPFLITYGFLMFNIGKANEKSWGPYIKFAGILGVIGNSFLVFSPIIILLIPQAPLELNMQIMILSYLGGLLWLVEYCFIFISGRRNDNPNFQNAGIFLIVVYIIQIFSAIILNIIYPPF